MLRLRIVQKTWYDGERMLRPQELKEHEHIERVIMPFERYGVTFHTFPINIGRSETNHLVLDDTTVSRRHAMILEEGGAYFICDLDSKAGIRVVDDYGVVKQGLEGKIQLDPKDSIKLGDTILTVLEPRQAY